MYFSRIRQGAAAVCLLSPLFCAAQQPTASDEVSYLSFEVPGALGTYPMSINNSMAVTGYYYVSSAVTRGFLRDADGAITTFSVGDGVWTEPESINADGDIAGFYEVVPGVPHGFIRYTDGRLVTFNPPLSGLDGSQAQPVALNAFGEVAGNYPFPNVAANGFTRSELGRFNTFDFALGAANSTDVTALNASGTVVGYVSPGGSYRAGFLLHPDGFSTQFDVPVETGQGVYLSNEVTTPESINADGVIAGWYNFCIRPCATTGAGGFVRSPQGVFTLFNPPGTIVTLPELGLEGYRGESLSAPHRLSINQEGAVAGSYTDALGAKHAFVRNPYGTITSFDPPKGQQTTATGMNDAGVIAGSYYYDGNGQTAVGFLRLPKP
jgi:hypothetical protein